MLTKLDTHLNFNKTNIARSVFLFLFFILTSCNPLATKPGSVAETNFRPGYNPNIGPSEARAFNGNYDFNNSAYFIPDTGVNTLMNNYVSVNASSNGLAELTATAPTGSSSSDFGSGTYGANSYFDSTNGGISLSGGSSATNNSELDASWTPKYSNIIRYYKFNGSGSILNSAAITATIGPNGSAVNPDNSVMAYTSGKHNEGILFDDTDSYVLFPLTAGTYNSFSISFWFKNISLGGSTFQYLFSSGSFQNLGTFNITFPETVAGYGHKLITTLGTSTEVKTSYQITEKETAGTGWHHYFISKNASSFTVYIDGNLINTTATSGSFSFPSQVAIGSRLVSPANRMFNGNIDDFALWNTDLTSNEVYAIYNRQSAKYSSTYTSQFFDSLYNEAPWSSLKFRTPFPFGKELTAQTETTLDYNGTNMSSGLGSGLIGLWHLNETSGTMFDSSAVGNNLTVNNVGLNDSSPLSGGVRFSGSATSNSYLSGVHKSAYEITDNFSIALWIKIQETPSTNVRIIYQGFGGFGIGQINADKKICLISSYNLFDVCTSNLTYNQWYHVAFFKNGSIRKAYLNAVDTTSVQAEPTYNVTSSPIYFGANPGTDYFKGSIDEVGIWNRVITSDEITQLYRRGANRVKFQTRICANNDCSDQTGSGSGWKGPDGTYLSYFSELNNSSSSGPTISLASGSGSGRYFQYRTILESDDTAATPTSPLVSLVQPGPTHYFNGGGAVIANGSTQAIPFTSLSGFTVTLGSGGCSSGVGYQLSYDNSTWKYWNGSSWTNASGTSQTNTEAEVNTNISSFTSPAAVGTNSSLYIRPILNSTGLTPCKLDNISVTGLKY